MPSKKIICFNDPKVCPKGTYTISINTEHSEMKDVYIRLLHNGLPDVFVKIGHIGWYFLLDTSVGYNLLDPCYFKEWMNYTPYPVTWSGIERYITPPPHEKLRGQKIICKDGMERVCKRVKFNFALCADLETKIYDYEEIFHLDPGLCKFYNSIYVKPLFHDAYFSKRYIGVLGTDFLRKHRWVLDYSEMEPHR